MNQMPIRVVCPNCQTINSPENSQCEQCGQPLPAQQKTKAMDEIYCPSCGKPIKWNAVMCVHCGVPNRQAAPPKDRTIAIILAVLFGFWTWVYTYQVDSWKFWVNLAVTTVTCGIWGLGAWIWAIIDVASRPQEFYDNFPNG